MNNNFDIKRVMLNINKTPILLSDAIFKDVIDKSTNEMIEDISYLYEKASIPYSRLIFCWEKKNIMRWKARILENFESIKKLCKCPEVSKAIT